MTLRETLKNDNKTLWLDIGVGGGNDGEYDPDFQLADVFAAGMLKEEVRERYHQLDIVNTTEERIAAIGQFDLVRMQHVFEHFSFEEGERVLKNTAKLLKPGGYLLISVPDLRVHIQKYLSDGYRDWAGFAEWANNRIPKDAPASAYFSIFTHSMNFEPHKWCYDAEGLQYQVERTALFSDCKVLSLNDPLSEVPFTHNRPEEDVCVLAKKA